MRIAQYLFACTLMYSMCMVCGYNNILTKAVYYQASISDTIVCCFKNSPTCITEPDRAGDTLDGIKKVAYFLPLTQIADQNFAALIDAIKHKKSDYALVVELVDKPLPGIKLTIRYNSHTIDFTCDRKQFDLDTYTLALRFIYKKVLEKLHTRTSANTVRWYALGKRQPRIVLDITRYTHTGLSFIKALQACLEKSQCEVIMLPVSSAVKTSLDNRISYINIVLQPDIYILLDENMRARSCSFSAGSSALSSVQAKQAVLLNKLKKLVSTSEKNTVGHELLAGIEMPAIAIHYSSHKYNTQMVCSIKMGIERYLRYIQNRIK